MNKKLLSVAIAAASLLTVTAKNNDPVLMTINGKDVHLSEFEYLYNKNNSQQLQQQSLDEYVDMFVTYKLKVADAEAAGLDTTKTFIKEFKGYRNDLARPYLRDASVEDSLIQVVHNHMKEDVDVSHIMMPLDVPKSSFYRNKLDSIRTEILNGASFEDNAMKFSIDGSVRYNQGRMGFISVNKYPYAFEEAAYDTPVGGISEVIESPFGLHIVKVHGRRPSSGKVLAQHILKFTQGLTPEKAVAKKAEIDSIYKVVKAGADFSEVAGRESDDPGSKRNGGMLPWFGSGEMVPEFEQVAFALENGAISEPFATAYGYHIIHKIDSKAVPTIEEARQDILNILAGDERSTLPERKKLAELKATHKTHLIDSSMDEIKKMLAENNGYDSTFIRQYTNSPLVVGKAGELELTLAEVIQAMPTIARVTPESGYNVVKERAESLLDAKTLEYEASTLHIKHADFRNLINEYRDGMLLFEISNKNVWEKASKDKEGLEAFFQKNKYKYTWDGPKYKGYIVFTTNDSIKNEIENFLNVNKPSNDSLSIVLRKKFARNVKVERVIAGRGENEIIDYIAFNGKTPTIKGKWKCFIPYNGRKISWAEEAADVRGPVTSDYQAVLEKEWVKSLHEKYPVKINKKVLNKIKKQ